ncbi:MAG: O-acetylhomoserine aminocarboxypropyltransferase/cysteine synthase [Epsilonproteobacteria bacterium]|nr:O-acetylhomoserine aminocarboxypropyltransferase/cysteine synthase [Campylobacterota bacterium]
MTFTKKSALVHPMILDQFGSAVPPLYKATSFAHDAESVSDIFSSKKAGFVYTRIGNPTVMLLESQINRLEDGIGTVAFSSGMAAISAVSMLLCSSKKEILASSSIFGGTYSLFINILSHYGVKTVFFNSTDELKRIISDDTAFIFAETIGNPSMKVTDIEELASIKKDVPLVVDATVTPYIFNGKSRGADIVVYSATKMLSGHGRAVGGAVVDCGNYDWANLRYKTSFANYSDLGQMAFLATLRQLYLADLGGCMSPETAESILTGMETLALRVKESCENAEFLAAFFEEKGLNVNYPKFSSYRQTARRQFNGYYGSILTIDLGSREKAFKFVDSLKLPLDMPNLCDTRTMAIHAASTIGSMLSEKEKAASGITSGLVRISVGIEDKYDLKNDFSNALSKAKIQ